MGLMSHGTPSPSSSSPLLLNHGLSLRHQLCSARSLPTLSRPRRHQLVVQCNKMFVPGFGNESPESKAASTLQNYFTYLAVKIVLAQLEEYNPEAYKDLRAFVDRTPINDGDKFCAALMRESPRMKGLAMRILEVRSAYASEDFEWENMRRLAIQYTNDANTTLMRNFLQETSSME